jgi:nitroreductase
MAGRHAVRAFLPTPIARATIEDILAVARRAPSGTNLQPWRVHVLTGAARQRLVDAVCAAYDADEPGHEPEYDYYPAEFFEPYLARRRHRPRPLWPARHRQGRRGTDARADAAQLRILRRPRRA